MSMVLTGVLFLISSAGFAQSIKPVEAVTTQKVALASNGKLRIAGSRGDLNIEAWDRPEVEVTVTRTSYRAVSAKDLDAIQVETKLSGTNEATVSTTLARGSKGIQIYYRIRAPKDANLDIQHTSGDVFIAGITGAIDAHGRGAGIYVMLPTPAAYSLQAKSKLGFVYSDFDGQRKRVFPLGTRFEGKSSNATKPVTLDTTRGGNITIQTSSSYLP